MNSKTATWIVTAATLGTCGAASADGLDAKSHGDTSLILGLDHIPIVVTDLTAARERYRQLGFTLKPGRPHDNGIRNAHVKFGDGTEIELLTVDATRDALAHEYLGHLAQGDGPVFVSLFAPEMDRVARHFDAAGRVYLRAPGTLVFPEHDSLRYIFFGQRNHSPTDRPEHFRHANGAEALIGVWIAGDPLEAERALLAGLGFAAREAKVHAPRAVAAEVAELAQGNVVFLPRSHQRVPERRIVGATIRVASIERAQRTLAGGASKPTPILRTEHAASIFVSPEIAHGIWLEFRQEQ